MSVLNPDHLLEQADRLITPPGGGAPRQADLRRAISNSYYAVFHAIAAQAADDIVGYKHRGSAGYALVYRSINHDSLRRLCQEIKKPTLPKKYFEYVPKGGFGSDLIDLANAVIDLQEKRHSADYDPLFRVKMSDALLVVATGRTALTRFRTVRAMIRKAFVMLLLFSPR